MEPSHDPRRLAVASTAPGIAAISHHSAAYLHGLLDTEPPLVHVLAVRGTHPAPPPGVIPHHTRSLQADELTTIDIARVVPGRGPIQQPSPTVRVTVTTPASTVVMLAAYLEPAELSGLIERSLAAGCTVAELWSAATRRRQRGRCGPRRVLDELTRWATAGTELISA